MEKKNNNTPVYISGMISDFLIIEYLNEAKRKIDYIRDTINKKLTGYFSYVKVFFSNESHLDPRMKFFQAELKPIYIPDISVKPDAHSAKLYNFYKTEVYEKERDFFKDKKLISEASVPFLYRAMIPFGYLQVNNPVIITEKDFSIVKKMGASVSELFLKNNIIKVSEDKILVTDLSKSGFVAQFKERILIKNFKENGYLQCNLLLPNNKKTSMLIYIKNINASEGIMCRIECSIINIDALGEVYYDEFLENNSNY